MLMYQLVYQKAADVGRYIVVKANYTDSNNNFESITSNFLSTYVTPPPVNRPPTGQSTETFPAGTEDYTRFTFKDVDYFQGFSDPDGDSLQAINIKIIHATITSANGVWNLTPDKNYNGTIELTYDVIDNKGGSIPAK